MYFVIRVIVDKNHYFIKVTDSFSNKFRLVDNVLMATQFDTKAKAAPYMKKAYEIYNRAIHLIDPLKKGQIVSALTPAFTRH